MDNLENLFEPRRVESISNFIEEKLCILEKVKDFKEKNQDLCCLMEEFEADLDENFLNKFKKMMKLNYQVEEYYLTLAYLLGVKFGRQLSEI